MQTKFKDALSSHGYNIILRSALYHISIDPRTDAVLERIGSSIAVDRGTRNRNALTTAMRFYGGRDVESGRGVNHWYAGSGFGQLMLF